VGVPCRRDSGVGELDARAPSQVRDTPWLWSRHPDPGPASGLDPRVDPGVDPGAPSQGRAPWARVGGWHLTPARTHHDQAWALIRDATRAGRLGVHATTSTAMPDPARQADGGGVIVIATRDLNDVDDVRRVLGGLRHLGVRRRLTYHADAQALTPSSIQAGRGPALYASPQDSRDLHDHRDQVPLLGSTPMTVVDVETTGLGTCPTRRIVEIAVHRLDGAGAAAGAGTVQDSLVTLVNPGVPIPPAATATHGITDAMVAIAPPFAAVAGEVARLLAGAIMVAHCGYFDYSFLWGEYRLLGRQLPRLPLLCTHQLTRRLRPEEPSYRLADCCELFGLAEHPNHSAPDDVTATVALLRHLLPEAIEHRVPVLADGVPALVRLLPPGWQAPWPPAATPVARAAA
jgi:DNA polymerase III epsilon subunit-like protein